MKTAQPSAQTQTAAIPVDNEKIVSLICAGDPYGEQLLYESYSRGLRYLASRYCPEYAEDCMQDSIMAAIQQIRAGKLDTPGALPGYLSIITKRSAWNKNLERKRRQGDEETFELVVNTKADTRPNPETAYEIEQRARLMKEGLNKLKPAAREILTRFYLQNQTPDEICQAMGLTATQFRLMKSRSKQVLEQSVQRTVRIGKPLNAPPSTMAAGAGGGR